MYDANGNEITGTNADKKLTNSNAIINEKEGAALEWSKVDGTDGSTALAGSEWQLQKKDSNEAYEITDSTKAVNTVAIQYNGNPAPTNGISLTYNIAVDLTAVVTDADGSSDGVPQAVKWSSSEPTTVSVSDGKILGLKNGTATITACSVADSTKCTKISVPPIQRTPPRSISTRMATPRATKRSCITHSMVQPGPALQWKALRIAADG